jgi:putative transcriptional regulator
LRFAPYHLAKQTLADSNLRRALQTPPKRHKQTSGTYPAPARIRRSTEDAHTIMPVSDLALRNDSILIDHAAGNLPGGPAFVVEAWLALNPSARAASCALDAVGARLLEQLEPSPIQMPAWLAETGPGPVQPHLPAVADAVGGLLESLDRGRWRRSLSGMLTKPVGVSGAHLLKIEAGHQVPEHGHRGLELTLVLSGALEDETGRYGRGALVVHDEDSAHTPGAVAGAGTCICLIAQTGPVALKGPLGWAINPFLR